MLRLFLTETWHLKYRVRQDHYHQIHSFHRLYIIHFIMDCAQLLMQIFHKDVHAQLKANDADFK